MEPLPHPRCPLCGGPNDCAPARAGDLSVPCWCSGVTVSPAALERVPDAWRRKACLCPRCAAPDEPPLCGDS